MVIDNKMQPRAHHILVFDSGVGGLSIVEHIRNTLPTITITYLADNALFPYGVLAEQQLIERVTTLITEVSAQLQCDLVVIGCNTASTLVLPHLRERLAIPIVGVVPAIKPAAILSHNKVIGLLATPGTINRPYTNSLIKDFAEHCEIIRIGSSALVQLVEDKLSGACQDHRAYQEILTPFREHTEGESLDTVILACTHFPLAIKELSLAAPNIKHWIDSGAAIAKQVERLLIDVTMRCESNNLALFTNIHPVNQALRKSLRALGFDDIQVWPNE